MIEKITLTIAILVTIGWIGGAAVAVYDNWQVGKDTNAWLERAQVASNPFDMQDYLLKCKAGMEKWEVTSGHAVFIFETPENDMSLIMEALQSNIDRCDKIKNFSATSIEYQTALDDVRGAIRELDLHTPPSWWYIHAFWLALWAWLGWIAMIIVWMVYGIASDL